MGISGAPFGRLYYENDIIGKRKSDKSVNGTPRAGVSAIRLQVW